MRFWETSDFFFPKNQPGSQFTGGDWRSKKNLQKHTFQIHLFVAGLPVILRVSSINSTNHLLTGMILQEFESTKESGQIIATSHDLTPNGGLVREILLFQGNPLVKYYDLPRKNLPSPT